MTGKIEKDNLTIALNNLYAKSEIMYSFLGFKTKLKGRKTSYFFNDSKRRRMAFSCSKKLRWHYEEE